VLGRNQEEAQASRIEGQVPVLAVFSLAGGVGKTSLVAAMGRGLAARGERVLLTDTCSFGVLPFYFGGREIKAGVIRTFSGGTSDPPIRVLTLDAERYEADPDLLRREMARGAQDVSRVLIDVATGSTAMLHQAVRMAPILLVPVVPDMASVVTLQALEGFFRNQEGVSGKPLRAWFVLNQFDAASALHLDVREVLRQQLGERLLPFAIHRSPAMSEALAEGMTVIDYAPNSPAAEDIMSLVTWIRSTSVAVSAAHRGARWSER
jgi:cellulose synthase operon protein YhjQ